MKQYNKLFPFKFIQEQLQKSVTETTSKHSQEALIKKLNSKLKNKKISWHLIRLKNLKKGRTTSHAMYH